MFGDELAQLVRQFAGRLVVVHLHTRADAEPPQNPHERTLAGRLTAERLAELLEHESNGGQALADADEWYLCGPQDLTATVTGTLTAHGVSRSRISQELFGAAPAGPPVTDDVVPATVRVTLGGRTDDLVTDGDESLLEAALRTGLEPPYSCTGGACGTCKVRLLHGSVHMQQNYALPAADVADGWILACQARATSDRVQLDYDS